MEFPTKPLPHIERRSKCSAAFSDHAQPSLIRCRKIAKHATFTSLSGLFIVSYSWNIDPGLAGETGASGEVGTVYPLEGLKIGDGVEVVSPKYWPAAEPAANMIAAKTITTSKGGPPVVASPSITATATARIFLRGPEKQCQGPAKGAHEIFLISETRR